MIVIPISLGHLVFKVSSPPANHACHQVQCMQRRTQMFPPRSPYLRGLHTFSLPSSGAYVACIWLPETLRMHHLDKVEALYALEAQIAASNSQDGKAKESGSIRMESTESLLKNYAVDVSNDPQLRLFSS